MQTETSEELLHLSARVERGEIEPGLCKHQCRIGFMPELHGIPNDVTKTLDYKCVSGTNIVDEDMPSLDWCLVPCQLQPNWNQLKSLVELGLPHYPNILKSFQIHSESYCHNLYHFVTYQRYTDHEDVGKCRVFSGHISSCLQCMVSRWCLLLS